MENANFYGKHEFWWKTRILMEDMNFDGKREFPRQIFEKRSNIKFHENPCSGSRVARCGRADRRIADMRKLIVAFRSLAKGPKTQEKAVKSRDQIEQQADQNRTEHSSSAWGTESIIWFGKPSA